ncbi:MAG: AmmeMemoRadiSam system radical SAM enzyme [Spirochaetales bacterium]|nr:AmmeMemoRadiSam system radical SAM enzyme [Spirochaetales bacterium]
MKEGRFFLPSSGGRVECVLCPRHCVLSPGQTGFCGVRANREGKGLSLNYGSLSAVQIDPIEKKPLSHFKPGTDILSLGSYGCNLSCLYCQNHQIARDSDLFRFARGGEEITPSMILEQLAAPLAGVAYTYNEPTVWWEFMIDCAGLVKEKGFANVMVTNGYIEPEPLRELLPLIDAFSVDLKGYSEEFYRDVSGGRLAPVKRTLKSIVEAGRHLEVEYLVVPGKNDEEASFEELMLWYARELGADVPLHINRYFPRHKMSLPATPIDRLLALYDIACKYLSHVHIGNAQVDLSKRRSQP